MDLFFNIIIFVLGLIIGSFLNCVIYRLEKGESFLKGHSFCPDCKHTLSWKDLIPVLSFLFLRGKCRYCKNKISWQHPIVELATGILFVLVYDFLMSDPAKAGSDILFYFIISSFLIVIFIYDLKHYLIPDKVIYPAIAITFIYDFLMSDPALAGSDILISAFGASAFFLLIVLATRGRGMGIGDIKLAFLMGLVLGWPNILVALFLAFMAGAIMGVGLIVAHKKSLKSEVPFGPFLVLGTLAAFFWGQTLINWYLSLL